MKYNISLPNLVNWTLGAIVFIIGALNLFLVHPVPGIIGLFLSLIYLPHVNTMLSKNFGFAIPLAAKVFLGLVVIWFTLGVSDLGDMLDKAIA